MLVSAAPGIVLPQVFWSGQGRDSSWRDSDNWVGNEPPASDGSVQVVFGAHPNEYSYTGTDWDLHSLLFTGDFNRIFLNDDGDSNPEIVLRNGLTMTPNSNTARVTTSDSLYLVLGSSQTWNITAGTLELNGGIREDSYEANYTLTKTGAGTLVLNSYSQSTGGIHLDMGTLRLGNDYALGVNFNANPRTYGTLTIAADSAGNATARPTLEVTNGDRTINNDVVLNGALRVTGEQDLELKGNVFLNQDTVVSLTNRFLHISGNITSEDNRSLTLDSYGALLLTGNNSYMGGTTSNRGFLIFGSADAIPSVHLTNGSPPAIPGVNLGQASFGQLTAGAGGYIGFADSDYAGSVQSTFINQFNKSATLGTIGLDSDHDAPTNTFTDNLDLTGFGATARLGSATRAILSGTITPQGTDYRFGGGGGWLQVDSALTDARALVLDSPTEAPLTLRLTNSGNNYSGGTSVTRSGVIFAAGALPAGTSDVVVNTGSYAGSEGGDLAGFLAHINPASTGMVGFDAVPHSTRTISDNLDLSAFTGALFLGTATAPWIDSETNALLAAGLTLTGTITPAGGSSQPFRFAAYKGGMLEVASALSGTHGIIVGDPNSLGSFGDINNEEYSTVLLSGNNTALSGGIQLNAGRLAVGTSTALGTGSVTVNPFTFPTGVFTGERPAPQLASTGNAIVLSNDFQLNTNLSIGGPNNFEIAGVISGPGGINVEDQRALGLSGSNTFSGGIQLDGGTAVYFYNNNASGTGLLHFTSDSSSEAHFSTSNPTVGGIASDYYGYLTLAAGNSIFTVNQAVDATFRGEIRSGSETDDIRFVKSGSGSLRLDSGGLYYHHGVAGSGLADNPEVGLEVNQGTLILGRNFYIEDHTPTVWVHGGTLVLDGGTHLDNPLILGSGGRLAGYGSLHVATIGAGAILSPGDSTGNSLGALTFQDHLTLAGGGIYEWNIQNPDPGVTGGRDVVSVGSVETLEITATTGDQFALKAISLDLAGNPGTLVGVVENQLYSWTLFATQGITGFDPSAFTIDVSQFTTDRGTGLAAGAFTVAQDGNNLVLNFTAVPEPSTYVLLALGLGLIVVSARRRRRA